jgi:lipoprotein NlpI
MPRPYNEGLIKVQKGDLDGAIAAYNQALDLDPKMAIAYYNRGNAKNSEGNLDGAIADYTQALVLNPSIALAYCNRGFARQSKGDSDGALADYAHALALNPKMAVALYNRGLIKVQKGDLDGAIADSSQAIDLDPKNGQAYCNRGLALMGKGNLDDAMSDLRKFVELVPRDSGADSARLYLWLIATEENPKGTADQDLSTSLLNDWNSTPEDLTSKIGAFLLGHINENALIADAASPDPGREPGQYCKVWYFAAMKRLLAGDTKHAITDFQKTVATQQNNYCEYIFAQAELQRLGQSLPIPAKAEASQ